MAFKQYRSDPLTEREKAYLRRSKGIVQAHSAAVGPKPADKPKERDYLAPTTIKPIKRRPGRCVMSPEIRAMVERRKMDREAFFRSL
jgi:hypothetical protein